MSKSSISAICFDVFGTLLTWRGRRLNPYLRLAQTGQRLPFMTRTVPIETFAGGRFVISANKCHARRAESRRPGPVLTAFLRFPLLRQVRGNHQR